MKVDFDRRTKIVDAFSNLQKKENELLDSIDNLIHKTQEFQLKNYERM